MVLGTRTGKCPECTEERRRPRPSSTAQGYGAGHRERFRPGVLAAHPRCVVCKRAPSTEADHWPRSRRELVAAGEDPDDPRFGRGLCKPCHSAETGRNQPAGWAAEPPPF